MSNGPVPLLSIIVPMHNEGETIDIFFARLEKALAAVTDDYEVICINDGSGDDTLDRLLQKRETDARVKVMDLSRNFGKEAAMTAGIECAEGRAVIPIDADLQDPPEIIGEMVEAWQQGNDVVLAIRKDRSADTALKRLTAGWFYRFFNKLGEVPIPSNAGDFRLMDRRVVEALKLLPERTRFMKGLFAWLGYRQTAVYFAREERAAGTSSWHYWKLWNFAVEGIVSFSTVPLKVWVYLGLCTALFAFFYMLVVVARTLFFGVDVPGYASLMAVVLFFSGFNMLILGIMGEYIGRIFAEVKRRPIFIVRKSYGIDEPED